MNRRPVRLACVVAFTLGLCAGHLPAEPDAGAVEPLVARLGAESWADREAAEEALVVLGDEALPALERAAEGTGDPEVADRVRSAIARIGRNRQFLGTMVDVGRRFDTPEAAYTHLAAARQLKLKFINADAKKKAAAPKPIALVGRSKPALQATDELIAATGLDCRISGDTMTIYNFPPQATGIPSVYSGALAIRAVRAGHARSVAYAEDKSTDALAVTLRVDAESKAKLVGEDVSIRFTEAVDEAGRSLLTDANRVVRLGRSGEQYQGNFSIAARDPRPKRIARWRGVLAAGAITASREHVIEDLAALPTTIERADMKIHLRLLDRPDGRQQIEFECEGESALRIDEDGVRVSNIDDDALIPTGGLRIEDAAGKPMKLMKLGHKSVRGWPIVPFLIEPGPDAAAPKRLVWTSVERKRDLRVPFAFAGLDLP